MDADVAAYRRYLARQALRAKKGGKEPFVPATTRSGQSLHASLNGVDADLDAYFRYLARADARARKRREQERLAGSGAQGPSQQGHVAMDPNSHCSWFATQTKALHQAAMAHPLLQVFSSKAFDKETYVLFLMCQYTIFDELEHLIQISCSKQPLRSVYEPRWHRAPALARDLDFWCGRGWEPAISMVSSSTSVVAHLAHIRQSAGDPWSLLCHHFVQYTELLSGGQQRRQHVEECVRAHLRYDVEDELAKNQFVGTEFYVFPECGQHTHNLLHDYFEKVNALSIPTDVREEMLGTMAGTFRCMLAVFEEMNALYLSRMRKHRIARQEAKVEHEASHETNNPLNGPGSWLLSKVTDELQALSYHPFINKFATWDNLDEDVYIKWLTCQLEIFRGLESCVSRCSSDIPLHAVCDLKMVKLVAIEHDLSFWGGSGWNGLELATAVSSSSTVAAYLGQLQGDVGDPWMLLCHHIVIHTVALLSSLSIGPMIREHVRHRLRADVEDELAANGDAGAEIFASRTSLRTYIGRVNELNMSDVFQGRMLEHMHGVLGLLSAVFDENCSLKSQLTHPPVADAAFSELGPALPKSKQDMTSFALDDLRTTDDPRLLVSILGRVYDLSADRKLFGKGGPYEMFVGHDGTYNLAMMTLKKKTLNKFDYTLDEEDKQTLADWIAYFDKNHGPPIGQLSDPVHSHVLTMKDLPAVKKIPFSSEEDQPEHTPTSRL